jgi:hypothetical protein
MSVGGHPLVPSSPMKKILIAVGSVRRPKLRAVTEALKAFAPKLVPDGDFEVVGEEVESGVSSTPTSSEELMRGAKNRAEALVRICERRGARILWTVRRHRVARGAGA